MSSVLPAAAEYAGRQLRAWLIVKLAGRSSVAVNLDVRGSIRCRGVGLVWNCRWLEPR